MSVEKQLCDALVAFLAARGMVLRDGPLDVLIIPVQQEDVLQVPMVFLTTARE